MDSTRQPQVVEHVGHKVLLLPHAIGTAALAIADCPAPYAEAELLVASGISRLRDLETVAATASENKALSDVGRREKTAPALETARRTISTGLAQVQRLAAEAAHEEMTLTAPPALNPDDVASRLEDSEIRAWYGSLVSDQFRAVDLTSPENQRILLALARSPYPSAGRTMAVTYWNAMQRDSTRPELLRIRGEARAAEWAHTVLSAMDSRLSATSAGAMMPSRVGAAA